MSRRRKGREAALQYLCGRDTQHFEPDANPEDFWAIRPTEPGARRFAEQLAEGVLSHQEQLDRLITESCTNYRVPRIAMVDRNILRIALFEMFHSEAVPPVVAIDEAVEIARKFGTSDSWRFVNGILDRARTKCPRDPRLPSSESIQESGSAPGEAQGTPDNPTE